MPPRRNPTRGGGGRALGPAPVVFPAPDAEIPLFDIDPHQQQPHLQLFDVVVFVPDLVAAPQDTHLRPTLGFPGTARFRDDPPGLRVEEIVLDADARFLRFRIRAQAGLGQLAEAARGAVGGEDFARDPKVPLCVQVADATGTGRLILFFSCWFLRVSREKKKILLFSFLPFPLPRLLTPFASCSPSKTTTMQPGASPSSLPTWCLRRRGRRPRVSLFCRLSIA